MGKTDKLVNGLIKKTLLLLAILASGCDDQCRPTDRYLVVTPFAGTSNRLRVLASAKIMAALTDRQLVVDWDIIEKEMPARWNQLFRNPMTTFEQSPLAKEGCSLKKITSAPEGDPTILNLGNQNDGKGVERVSRITEDQEPIIYFGTSLGFQPDSKYMTTAEYQERYRLFYQNLDPANWVTAEVKKFQTEHNFSSKFPIGVHYRAWNMSFADHYVKNDPENQYLTEFVEEMKKAVSGNTSGKEVVFFLATDDPKVKEKLLAVTELKGKIVTRDVTIERETILGQQSALVDWFLLGSTNYIIGTYQSSFSDEAAHLTVQNRKTSIGDPVFH